MQLALSLAEGGSGDARLWLSALPSQMAKDCEDKDLRGGFCLLLGTLIPASTWVIEAFSVKVASVKGKENILGL